MSASTAPATAETQSTPPDQPTLPAYFQATVSHVPDRTALRTLGDQESLTWSEYGERVREVAAGLHALGVRRGDTVAIMAVNSPIFHICDTAALHLGATTVSVYNTLPPDDVSWLLSDAGVRVVLAQSAFLPQLLQARDGGSVDQVVLLDGTAPDTLPLDDLVSAAAEDFDFEATWRAVEPDDVAVLIYTSGTTGNPKGVELTQDALIGNLKGMDGTLGAVDGARVISFLPMAHIAERQFSHYRPMLHGFTVTSCEDPREVPKYLGDVRPTYFFSPPRLFEKLRAAIEAGVAADENEERGAAVRSAIDNAVAVVTARQAGTEVNSEQEAAMDAARERIFRPMLERFGLERVVSALTGSAPVAPDLSAFWIALGLPLSEAWGLSECGAFGAIGRPSELRFGTVGTALPGIELRLLDDGEILLKSKYLMRGYRNLPDVTAETIDADGWLHTGDIGVLDDQGYLKIVDRKKELIINASGKNMSPANIEAKIKDSHPLIGQACVIGNSRPYNVALLVLDPDVAAAMAAKLGRPDATVAELATDERVREQVEAGVAAANERLSRVEQIKKFELLATEWLPGQDELTPTMKLKRKPIDAKYAEAIEALYAD